MGTIAASYVSGLILYYTNSNWELVFYFFGALAIVWFIFFVSNRTEPTSRFTWLIFINIFVCYM